MKLTVFVLLLTASVSLLAAEEVIREGEIYATVELAPDGGIQVLDVYSDLPADVHPDIKRWLETQTVVLADAAAESPRVIEVHYEVIEQEDKAQALAMAITDSNATLPDVASKGIPVQVRVYIRADGTVTSVEPESDLPRGVSQEELEQTVAESIESDPVITDAVANETLSDSVQTMTVIIKQRDR